MFLLIWICTVIFSLLVTVVFLMDICNKRTERTMKAPLRCNISFKIVMQELFTTLWGLKLFFIGLIPVINIIIALLILFAGDKVLDDGWDDIWEMVDKEEE